MSRSIEDVVRDACEAAEPGEPIAYMRAGVRA
jgi:hypothetical protein